MVGSPGLDTGLPMGTGSGISVMRVRRPEGVEFYHKQGSAFRPGQDRILDGRTHDDYPEVKHQQEAMAI